MKKAILLAALISVTASASEYAPLKEKKLVYDPTYDIMPWPDPRTESCSYEIKDIYTTYCYDGHCDKPKLAERKVFYYSLCFKDIPYISPHPIVTH